MKICVNIMRKDANVMKCEEMLCMMKILLRMYP